MVQMCSIDLSNLLLLAGNAGKGSAVSNVPLVAQIQLHLCQTNCTMLNTILELSAPSRGGPIMHTT